MGDEARYREFNRDLWDKRVRAHLQFGLYPSAEVADGSYSVGFPEPEEVGDVRGKRLLHLQCNAGADTLWWARRGASVVGLDFSQEAIAEAQRLALVTGLDARFVCSDVYAAHEHDLGLFDVVYTSTGVLWWLPDLDGWAKLIVDHLKPGGFFYIHEIHPAGMIYDWQSEGLDVANDYFADAPLVEEASYEYDFAQFRQFKCFERNDRDEWRPKDKPRLPWAFTLKATK